MLHLGIVIERLPRDCLQSVPSLKKLTVNGDEKLMEVTSLNNLPKLKELQVDIMNMERLPKDRLQSVSSLEVLRLNGGGKLMELPSLEVLRLNGGGKLSLDNLPELKRLEVSMNVKRLPRDCLQSVPSLEVLYLNGGGKLMELPSLDNLPELKKLEVSMNMIKRLPRDCLQSVPRLEALHLNGGGKLMELPSLDNLPELQALTIVGLSFKEWHITPDEYTSFANLLSLRIADCEHLEKIPCAFDILPAKLRSITLERCALIEQLPDSFDGCLHFEIIDCKKLTHLPVLKVEHSWLKLSGLDSLEALAHLGCVRSLELERTSKGFLVGTLAGTAMLELSHLVVKDAGIIKHLPPLECPKLDFLHIDNCAEMETILLDDNEWSWRFPELRYLRLTNLPKLVRLPPSLKPCNLHVEDCPSLD